MQENHVSMHKTDVYTNETMLYLHTHFLEYTETFLCPHSVIHLQQSSLDWQNYLDCLFIDFFVLTQGCVWAFVKSFFVGWESYFLDKNLFTTSDWFDSVFGTAFKYLHN